MLVLFLTVIVLNVHSEQNPHVLGRAACKGTVEKDEAYGRYDWPDALNVNQFELPCVYNVSVCTMYVNCK